MLLGLSGNKNAGGGVGVVHGHSGLTKCVFCCRALDFTMLWMKWPSNSLAPLLEFIFPE